MYFCPKCKTLEVAGADNIQMKCDRCGGYYYPLHIKEDKWDELSADEKKSVLYESVNSYTPMAPDPQPQRFVHEHHIDSSGNEIYYKKIVKSKHANGYGIISVILGIASIGLIVYSLMDYETLYLYGVALICSVVGMIFSSVSRRGGFSNVPAVIGMILCVLCIVSAVFLVVCLACTVGLAGAATLGACAGCLGGCGGCGAFSYFYNFL